MKTIDLSHFIQLEGPIFEDIQRSRIFKDSKTFVDCVPKIDPSEIRSKYEALKGQANFDLAVFAEKYFALPDMPAKTSFTPGKTMEAHIDTLWDYLSRTPDPATEPYSTLLPLKTSYIVPGGRFREIYYWDSYFSALGLAVSGRLNMVENLIKNFSHLIQQVGHVPNGNRQYYRSRSQPPFFFLLLRLLERHKGRAAIAPYLSALQKEYHFWMQGSDTVSPDHPSHRRVVCVGNNFGLYNRYWDDRPLPREESWREDIEAAQNHPDPSRLYRDLRAGAESGWDFSSRWLSEPSNLSSIRTTQILPVDLNALLWGLELKLGEWIPQAEAARSFTEAAGRRKEGFNDLFWSEPDGYYFDYDFAKGGRTRCWSLAGVYPLFLKLASGWQARKVAAVLERHFLKKGGLVTSLHETGQQWDLPNGWAPLQWVTVIGLKNYGFDQLAGEITERWLNLNRRVFQRTGKMMEKYNVCDLTLEGGGGEYPLQDGFGWTNGVAFALSHTTQSLIP